MEMLAIRDTPLNWRSLTWKLKAECVYTNGPTKPLLEIEFRVSLDDHRFFFWWGNLTIFSTSQIKNNVHNPLTNTPFKSGKKDKRAGGGADN